MYPNYLSELIRALKLLPSVGERTAERMALYMLIENKELAQNLSDFLTQALKQLNYCEQCRNFSGEQKCDICSNPERNNGMICVVESPRDLSRIERIDSFSGTYFVLHGVLSAKMNFDETKLGVEKLCTSIQQRNIQEVILALNHTVESQATAHFLLSSMPSTVKVSQLASGIPVGTELEYISNTTLIEALQSRRILQNA